MSFIYIIDVYLHLKILRNEYSRSDIVTISYTSTLEPTINLTCNSNARDK